MTIFSTKIIRNNLLKENRNKLIKNISDALKKHSEISEAYFFGSFANSTYNNDSDIDLLIVANTDKIFTERNRDYAHLLNIYAPIDILVYTSEEFIKIQNDNENGFWKKFKENNLKII